MIRFIIIDLFCGAGGATEGVVQAEVDGNAVAKVIAAVNHSDVAIASHSANHTDTVHFTEDIRTLRMHKLRAVVAQAREQYPGAMLCIWASVECTNYSKAKGGQPRDADSRTLPQALYRYVATLAPDYLFVENVVEFMAWGELDAKGRPLSMRNGRLWLRWVDNIKGFGYRYQHRILNAADFGAHTRRERYFACFSLNGHPIAWPEPTHARNPVQGGMFGNLKRWRPVKEVLDFEDEGKSIFERKKPLAPRTLERIYAGLIKYVAGGKAAFMAKYFSGRPKGKVYDLDGPCHTITTSPQQSLIRIHFIQKTYAVGSNDPGHYPTEAIARSITTRDGSQLVAIHFLQKSNGGHHESKMQDVAQPAPGVTTSPNISLVALHFIDRYFGTGVAQSVDDPAGTVTTKDRNGLVAIHFIDRQFTSGGRHQDVESPAGSIPTVPKMNLVEVRWLDKTYSGPENHQSVEMPSGTILTTDKHYLMAPKWLLDPSFANVGQGIDEPAATILASRKHRYLMNPQYMNAGGSVEQPCFTIIARMDKKPPYLVSAETGHPVAIAVYADDTPEMVKIKEFMALYGIIDIKMRMLRVDELKKIMGFPELYHLAGNQTQQKWQIGNAVHPLVPKHWMEALAERLIEMEPKAIAV